MEIQNSQSLYGQVELFQASYSQKYENQITRYGDDRTVQKSSFEAQLTIFQQDVKLFSREEFNGQSESLYAASSNTKVFTLDISITRETSYSDQLPPGQAKFDQDGFWGIEKTGDRIAKFVTKGAGFNLDRLRHGREGILQGFKQAEKQWGGELPEISYETIKKALETVDERIREAGGSAFEIRV